MTDIPLIAGGLANASSAKSTPPCDFTTFTGQVGGTTKRVCLTRLNSLCKHPNVFEYDLIGILLKGCHCKLHKHQQWYFSFTQILDIRFML